MRPTLVLALLIAITGCGADHPKPKHTDLTQREHDRILAGEPLPGANVVNRALIASDRETIRNQQMAAQIDSLPR